MNIFTQTWSIHDDIKAYFMLFELKEIIFYAEIGSLKMKQSSFIGASEL